MRRAVEKAVYLPHFPEKFHDYMDEKEVRERKYFMLFTLSLYFTLLLMLRNLPSNHI
jgi:hypothetical protein